MRAVKINHKDGIPAGHTKLYFNELNIEYTYDSRSDNRKFSLNYTKKWHFHFSLPLSVDQTITEDYPITRSFYEPEKKTGSQLQTIVLTIN